MPRKTRMGKLFYGLREFQLLPNVIRPGWFPVKSFLLRHRGRRLAIIAGHLYYLPQHWGCHINDRTATSYYCLYFRMWLNASLPLFSSRISNEHSPKLQIRSHSYLRAVSEVSINRSLDSLDPAGLLTSPKFRSRNESYMRAMSTISQVSTVAAGH